MATFHTTIPNTTSMTINAAMINYNDYFMPHRHTVVTVCVSDESAIKA